MRTKIPYATDSLNPMTGCQHVSSGCDNCYAEIMAARICQMNPASSKYKLVITNGRWNGSTSMEFKDFLVPLSWKKPRRVFLCSMGDMFYEQIPTDWIDRMMAIIALCPMHTFLVLTKRPRIMAKYFSAGKEALIERWQDQVFKMDLDNKVRLADSLESLEWPVKNLWLGVTAENQDMADYRIPLLLDIPAAKRFVSVEPMLTPVDLTRFEKITFTGTIVTNALAGVSWYKDIDTNRYDTPCNKLDWVICGAESGPRHREMKIEWAHDLKNQCVRHNVPFFYKQAYIGNKLYSMPLLDSKTWDQVPQ